MIGGHIKKLYNCILYPHALRHSDACFFACFFGEKIWRTSENFVPLHCQRKKTKFAA